MITIDFYDGNRFLARQPRQPGHLRRTLQIATFAQQFARKPANSRGYRRDICATPETRGDARDIGAGGLPLTIVIVRTAGGGARTRSMPILS
jgi:hypothetical protein